MGKNFEAGEGEGGGVSGLDDMGMNVPEEH